VTADRDARDRSSAVGGIAEPSVAGTDRSVYLLRCYSGAAAAVVAAAAISSRILT